MKHTVAFCVSAIVGLTLVAASSLAGLLGVNIAIYPRVVYTTTSASAITYTASNQLFTVTAPPTSIQFSSTQAPVLISGTKSLSISVKVDNSGNLIGGVPANGGNDFVLSGTVKVVTGGVTNTYTGVLLTGAVTGFGFEAEGATSLYDFRFNPNGGALLGYFSCGDIGVQVTSGGSTFTGSFSVNFNGQAKGTAGLEDLIPPTVICPTNVTLQCNASSGGQGGSYYTYPAPAGTDNCSSTNLTFIYTPPSGSFFALPYDIENTNYTVTLAAIDASGNSNTCSFMVTVEDTTPPVLDVADPIIGQCEEAPFVLTNVPGQCSAPFTFEIPTAFDQCCTNGLVVTVSAVDQSNAVIMLTNNGDGTMSGNFPVTCTGTNVITSVATDGRGNTAQAQCDVLVVDIQPPVINCASDQVVECTANTPAGGAINFQEPTAYDNCPNLTVSCVPTNGSVLPLGTNLIVYVASDCSGNTNQCSFYVIVQDTTAPTISCPANMTLTCGQSTNVSNTGTATASDTCDSSPVVTYSDAMGPVNCTGLASINRTWKATDASGNSVTCVQSITFTNTVAPTVTVPAGSNLGCNPATPPTVASVKALVTVSSGCSTPVLNVSCADSTNGCSITRTFTVTASDGCGNTSAPQTVVYTWTADTTAPTVTVPAGGNLGCNPASLPTAASVKALVTATDSCSTPTINVTSMDSGSACAMTRTFTVTAVDSCGNTSAAQVVVYTWTANTTAPTITCPAPVTVQCPAGVPPVNIASVSASAACGTATVTWVSDVITNQTCPNHYTILRTYRAVDACGNSATCTQTITVNDTVAPTITCPTNITVLTASFCTNSVPASNASIVAFLHGVTAVDNCGNGVTVSNNAPANFTLGSNTVTFTATDSCGNTATCKASVIVVTQTVTCKQVQWVPSFCQHHFDGFGNCQFATFEGNLTLSDGDEACDFRTSSNTYVSVTVTIGTNAPTVVYCKSLNLCSVQSDGCGGEAWEFFGNNPYERAICRFTDNQAYNACMDPNLPVSKATGNKNCGELSTVSIGATSTRFYYGFQQATQPMTIVVDGIAVLSVSNNHATSTFPFSQSGKTIQCTFPERLVPGNVIQWYSTSDPSKVSSNCLVYSQQTSASNNATATYFNEGGVCEFQVPTTGIGYNSNDRSVCVQVMIGQPGVTGKVACWNFCEPLGGMGNQDWQFGNCSQFQDEFAQEADDNW
ncbi:MAG TPA: HYR domain-containing protein [Verrucomicrobiae bacterium]|nr:HYR domain-containing protein [Verrucomicrobiae bacterium]